MGKAITDDAAGRIKATAADDADEGIASTWLEATKIAMMKDPKFQDLGCCGRVLKGIAGGNMSFKTFIRIVIKIVRNLQHCLIVVQCAQSLFTTSIISCCFVPFVETIISRDQKECWYVLSGNSYGPLLQAL